MAVRVLIIDDHAIVRVGMRLLLENDPTIEVVGEGETGIDAIKLAKETKPDVIVMDVTMPQMNGITATQNIVDLNLPVAVLALTIHEGTDYFFQMLEAGAAGYLPKRAAPEELIRAIHVVAEGHVYLEPAIAKDLVSDYLKQVKEGLEKDSYDGLTEREQEVLTYIAEDHSNQAIASALYISVKTVERHRENIMGKLNLHSLIELVKYAIRRGLITLDD